MCEGATGLHVTVWISHILRFCTSLLNHLGKKPQRDNEKNQLSETKPLTDSLTDTTDMQRVPAGRKSLSHRQVEVKHQSHPANEHVSIVSRVRVCDQKFGKLRADGADFR